MPEEKCCGTCGWWTQGGFGIIGECGPEAEGTPSDHVCDINLWKPRDPSQEILAEIRQTVIATIAVCHDFDPAGILPETTLKTDLGMDWVDWNEVRLQIEKRFDIALNSEIIPEKVQSLIETIYDIISKRPQPKA